MTEIIAEIGSNHGGSIATALQMIVAAKEAGADAVKTQKRQNKTLYTRSFYDAPYHSEGAFGPTYGEHREALEFGKYEHRLLKVQAEDLGLKYYCTAFDFASVDVLEEVGVDGLKLASGSITNTPLLEYAARTDLPLYLSSGAADLEDVKRAVDAVSRWRETYTLLACTAVYPCPAELLDLGVIGLYKALFPELTIGYSSHLNGIWDGPVAVTLGAKVIEKHFTLDRTGKGTDHAFSLEPQGLKKMVRDIKRLEKALGSQKIFHPQEVPAQVKMGSALYASRDLPACHELSVEDIAIRSPAGVGLPPYMLLEVVGKRLVRPLRWDEPITERDIDGRLRKAPGETQVPKGSRKGLGARSDPRPHRRLSR